MRHLLPLADLQEHDILTVPIASLSPVRPCSDLVLTM